MLYIAQNMGRTQTLCAVVKCVCFFTPQRIVWIVVLRTILKLRN